MSRRVVKRKARRGDPPLTFLVTWLFIGALFFWPLMLHNTAGIVIECIWLPLCIVVFLMYLTGKRR